MPWGPSCRTWTRLGSCDPISAWSGHSSAQQAGSGLTFHLCPFYQWKEASSFLQWLGDHVPTDRHRLQWEWGCKQRCLTASVPKFPNISLLILHNLLGIDPPDFPTANLDSSACVHVSIDGSCFGSGTWRTPGKTDTSSNYKGTKTYRQHPENRTLNWFWCSRANKTYFSLNLCLLPSSPQSDDFFLIISTFSNSELPWTVWPDDCCPPGAC